MSATMTILERRKAPRLRVESIVDIEIEEENGGIISNVCERGLCFQATAPVERSGTLDFCLFEPSQRIRGKGRVVWTDETRKRGGLCFAKLSVHVRERIYRVLSQSATTPAVVTGGEKLRGDLEAKNLTQLASIPPQPVQNRFFRWFAAGLLTGILVSLMTVSAFVYRRQIGGVLILMGEHLASTFRLLCQQNQQPGERRSRSARKLSE